MNRSVAIPRPRTVLLVAVAVTVALAAVCLIAFVRSGAAVAASPTVEPANLLTLRSDGDHDDVWLLTTAGGEGTRVGELPGPAAWAAVSPDRTTVAYEPADGRPEVWIGTSSAAPRTISLRGAGIKKFIGVSWASDTTLLISGSKTSDVTHDGRLYTVDVTTGAVTSFRNLSGTEANVSPDTGKVAYVKFKTLDNGNKKNDYTPKYRESLMLTSMTGTGAGAELDSQTYRPMAEYRAFAWPLLAPGGDWVGYAQTGSDVSVTYYVAYLADSYMLPWYSMWQSNSRAMAWAPASPLLALGGTVTGPDDSLGCIYITDPAEGSLGRTPMDLLSKNNIEWVDDIAWSDGTQLVADGTLKVAPAGAGASSGSHVLLLDTKDLTKLTDLGEGMHTVWVK